MNRRVIRETLPVQDAGNINERLTGLSAAFSRRRPIKIAYLSPLTLGFVRISRESPRFRRISNSYSIYTHLKRFTRKYIYYNIPITQRGITSRQLPECRTVPARTNP
jgi:hypothetical protein